MSEARQLLEFFTNAKDGEAVMDGAGNIWHHSGGSWYTGSRRKLRQASSLDLARGLCPDLADEMTELATA